MDSFNLTLNCAPKKCLNKGLQKFYTVLPEKINLIGEWEVALSEISFFNNIYNVENKEILRIITPQKIYNLNEFIEPALYTIRSLVESINLKVAKHFEDLSNQIPKNKRVWDGYQTKVTMSGIKYTIDNYKYLPDWSFKQIPNFIQNDKEIILETGISSNDELFFVQPSKNLCNLLGFDANEILIDALDKYNRFDKNWPKEVKENFIQTEKTLFQKYRYKTFEKFNAIYVCSDIANPIIFGENYQPLLRYINFDNFKNDEIIHLKFKNPYFIKVRKSPFERIEINIYKNLHFLSDVDAYETPYWMKYGEFKIVLQFRKVSNKVILYENEIPKSFKKPHDSTFDIIKFYPQKPPSTLRIVP